MLRERSHIIFRWTETSNNAFLLHAITPKTTPFRYLCANIQKKKKGLNASCCNPKKNRGSSLVSWIHCFCEKSSHTIFVFFFGLLTNCRWQIRFIVQVWQEKRKGKKKKLLLTLTMLPVNLPSRTRVGNDCGSCLGARRAIRLNLFISISIKFAKIKHRVRNFFFEEKRNNK